MKRRELEEAVELIIWRSVGDANYDEPHRAAKEIVAKLIAIGALNVDDEVSGGSK